MEAGVLGLRSGIVVFGAVQIVCGLAWIILVVPKERQTVPS